MFKTALLVVASVASAFLAPTSSSSSYSRATMALRVQKLEPQTPETIETYGFIDDLLKKATKDAEDTIGAYTAKQEKTYTKQRDAAIQDRLEGVENTVALVAQDVREVKTMVAELTKLVKAAKK
mmetsp:Transcript_5013/g.16435  ORF Transcript_5013/g.16435 Transcript_5013/m.16435 type:complete len:124 (+) Transcript_5013:164-535(+)